MRNIDALCEKLVCPVCAGGPLRAEAGSGDASLRCLACGAAYGQRDGVPDLAGAAEEPRRFSSQWAMEFGPLVAVYERIWRPLVTLPFSDAGWELRSVLDRLELSPSSDVLDLACGPGNFTRSIARACPSGQVVGADLSWPMLRRGVRELRDGAHPNVTLMRVDVTRWPYAAGSFDRVHCAGALHLFPQLDRVLASVQATLRPGGVFACATYCVADSEAKQRFQRHVSRVHGFHWFDPVELRALVEGAGLTDWHQSINREGIVFRARKPVARRS